MVVRCTRMRRMQSWKCSYRVIWSTLAIIHVVRYYSCIPYGRSYVSYTRISRNHCKTVPISFSHLSSVSHDFYILYIMLLSLSLYYYCPESFLCVFVLSSRALSLHEGTHCRRGAALPWLQKNKYLLHLNKYALETPAGVLYLRY